MTDYIKGYDSMTQFLVGLFTIIVTATYFDPAAWIGSAMFFAAGLYLVVAGVKDIGDTRK